jgi:hypothetical protein
MIYETGKLTFSLAIRKMSDPSQRPFHISILGDDSHLSADSHSVAIVVKLIASPRAFAGGCWKASQSFLADCCRRRVIDNLFLLLFLTSSLFSGQITQTWVKSWNIPRTQWSLMSSERLQLSFVHSFHSFHVF